MNMWEHSSIIKDINRFVSGRHNLAPKPEVIRKLGHIIDLFPNNCNKIPLTRRLKPSTLRHFSTGSVYKRTSSYFLKWLRNVVLPAPMLPSINTVNGALRGEVNFGMADFNTFDIIYGNFLHNFKWNRKLINSMQTNTTQKNGFGFLHAHAMCFLHTMNQHIRIER